MPWRSEIDPSFNMFADADAWMTDEQAAALRAPRQAPASPIPADGVTAEGNYYRDVNGERQYKWINPLSGWDGTSFAEVGNQQQVWSANQPDISLAEWGHNGTNPFGLMSTKTSDFLTPGDIALIGSMAAVPFGVGAMTGAAGMSGGLYGGAAGFEAGSAAAGASGVAGGGAAAAGGGGGAPALTGAYDAALMDPAFANYTGATAPQGISVPGYGSVYGGQYATGALKDGLMATSAGKTLLNGAGGGSGGSGTTPGQGGSINIPGIGNVPLGLLGAGAGALLGGLGGGSSPAGTVTSVQDVPAWQKPFVLDAMQGAQSQFHGMDKSTGLLAPAQAQMASTIKGDYLMPGSNPYLQGTFDQAARSVTDQYKNVTQPRNDALFNGPGSLGKNTAYQQTVARNQYGLGENLQNLATNIFGGNYQNERARQFGAAAGAPAFTNDSVSAQFSPHNAYANVVSRQFGQTNTQPYFRNQTAEILGGGLLGGSIFGGFK